MSASFLSIFIMFMIIMFLSNAVRKSSGRDSHGTGRKAAGMRTYEKSITFGSEKNKANKAAGGFGQQAGSRGKSGRDENADISCRQYGHDHKGVDDTLGRFIVHDEPEDGYILLNGVKLRISEADDYENRI